jgi:hypothetical protein
VGAAQGSPRPWPDTPADPIRVGQAVRRPGLTLRADVILRRATTRWNILGYPTFVVTDHHGMIRYKDLHLATIEGFDGAIEPLLKGAEAGAPRR